ncbi:MULTISPECIES: 4-hydroxyphenylpyruvate dioxygenase [unclassified Mesorhizobium]|uniref:4-hydroxyphenylpyruvate dioxygenase n=2 Tax=Mesorhizobium TaxID=68287 RepID=UPI000F75F68C|nr:MULTISPECIES: 4-hydroxyphenylpyruvate dioxygenase [unclassified Mesorhizobium]AZO06803.1 4-hydroxyphenylpyruvate dioxygenase [Mesorhizobium sp. M2A.F.Ca.ET.043.02.1.1]RUW42091.1 4-hydroxyphenylpyruvate dioxygenase [Mesorhizobium sp. M2A.F.Ca.ET.015.02.1.1]RVC93929.1 4-hydroxyphenylpyruvate dioxygenase [Mesorhizobium sp. M2A.F.Ca.ET.017.03.2.1]RVD01087.1 4-hydroxyphenylpyruvate dioxygenase [Mesorhizobium sp. M2A.F.Ca.ET.029.05.1.1]RWB42578.1 MAG: 4-hydroxyphenylpyruvate dioxygenase [Mesorhiz
MGPFPHDAPPAKISKQNPAGTDGFEFVEFAHPEPANLAELFTRMGYTAVAKHRTKDITVWRQGDINYVVNAEPGSHATKFVEKHGPCAASMAWRVVDAKHAFEHAVAKGATPYEGTDKALDVPAIVGIGGSLLYFIEAYGEKGSAYDAEFEWLGERDPKPEGVGFYYLDHLTHNVYRGNMDKWWDFYRDLFGFKQIHFFDIDGKITGLVSRAITSPCGKIRIPLNESKDETSQIAEYLKKYNGEGIQHIAVGTDAIYEATDKLAANGLKFMPGPPDTYYEMSHERVHGHDEPIERMKKHGILIDGEGVVDGGMTKILLQIFSKTVIGPIFFEFIQRKGDEGFGEGNFRALFESIEQDQIKRGVIKLDGKAA